MYLYYMRLMCVKIYTHRQMIIINCLLQRTTKIVAPQALYFQCSRVGITWPKSSQ